MPDARLARSFDQTDPEIVIRTVEPFDDQPTLPRWFLPGLGFLVAGVLISRWVTRRNAAKQAQLASSHAVPSAVPTEVGSGFDLLGAA